MPDREKVIKGLQEIVDDNWMKTHADWYVSVCSDALALLKEQDELLHKKHKDIDRLCAEISEWKHKYHDRPLKEQEAVVHPEPSCEMTYITDCCCDLCGVQLIREDNFCRCCGKPIVWERSVK